MVSEVKDREVEGVAKCEYQSRIHLPTAEMLATNNSAVDNFMFVEMVGEDVVSSCMLIRIAFL